MEINALEELAILTALKKTLDAKLKEVRAEVDDDMAMAYRDDGVEKKALKVGDRKVGNIILVMAKDDYAITDREAFEDFALGNGFASRVETIRPEDMHEAVLALKEDHGDLVSEEVMVDDGWRKYAEPLGDSVVIAGTDHIIPGVKHVAPHPKYTMIKDCKPEVVLPLVSGDVYGRLLGVGDE